MKQPSKSGIQIPVPNMLWLARKRCGFPQKWVAALLGLDSVSIISGYEQGFKTPSLAVALKLQLIYRTPLVELFPGLHALGSAEVAAVRERRPYIAEREKSLSPHPEKENTQSPDPCTRT